MKLFLAILSRFTVAILAILILLSVWLLTQL